MTNRNILWLVFFFLMSSTQSATAAPGAGINKARPAKGSSKAQKVPRQVKLPPASEKLPDMWLATSLGWDGIVVSNMSLHEGLDGTSLATVDITAPFAPETLLGQEATLALRTSDGFRYFNGYITKVETHDKNISLTIQTFMGLFSKTANAQAIENVSIPRALYKVLDRHQISSFQFKLLQRYKNRNLVVQYRETDLNFVKRLVEDIGLLTSVKHTRKGHQVIFSDTQPRRLTLHLQNAVAEGDNSLTSWDVKRSITFSKYTLANHQNGEPVLAASELKSSFPLGGSEVFDFEPSNASKAELHTNAALRLQESLVDGMVASGGTEDRRLRAGDVVKIDVQGTDSGNYLVTESYSRYSLSGSRPVSGQTRFKAIPVTTRYRPRRKTPWPSISGLQRAQVIDADPGANRLRIRFSWDRAKSAKRKGSAWVSLLSPMRATNFSKGDWVAIGFSDGDVNLPIVLTSHVPSATAAP